MKHVRFTCNLWDQATALPHFWEHTVGSGHAPEALRGDWQRQLRNCRTQLGFRHVRFHALLSDEMGTLMNEENAFVYSFFNADQICDFLLSIGMKPFVELSFMPTALASGGKTVFHYGANVTPPKDYDQWATLIWCRRRQARTISPMSSIRLQRTNSSSRCSIAVPIRITRFR
jgi:xylan 1,4-beta-xylosidase